MITRLLLDQAGLKADQADGGAVTLIQRFGSAANLNMHLHGLVLAGVYRRGTDGTPEFVEVASPTDEALQVAMHRGITRTMKLLARRGVLVEEQGQTYMADNDSDSDAARVLRLLPAAACTYRIAFGPRAGQKVLTRQGAMPRATDFKRDPRADTSGFSLHAAVRCGADERRALERLCRYITRPALANERVQCNAAGQVVLKLKTPWRGGTTPLVMSPLEFVRMLGGVGRRMRLSQDFSIYGQVGVGSGGYAPGLIDTGPGLLVYPKVSLEYALTRSLGVALSAGYLTAPKATSRNQPFALALTQHL